MAFAIEVPAETNPLTEGLLIHTLRSASSSDPHQIQSGTKQLQQWEKSEHYYVHLQAAYLDRRLPLELRYLAIIQLKNGIDKYWRKTALNAVSKEDKAIIRSRLIDGALNENDSRLALQDALVTAKIARFEFPNDWPDAISSIVARLRQSLQSGNLLAVSRTLLLLLHITKELSTGRLQRTRQNLQSATPEIVRVVGDLYATRLREVTQLLAENRDPAVDIDTELRQCLLAIKLIRRLLVFGYEHPNRDQDVASFWQLSFQYLGSLTHLTKNAQLSPLTRALLEKHMLQLSKLHHEMARDHPAAFVLLPDSLDLVIAYWTMIKEVGEQWGSKQAVTSSVASASIGQDGDVSDRSSSEKFALRGMLVIRACIKMVHNPAHTFKYRQPQDKQERAQAVELIQDKILSEDFVREVMNIVVTRFFVFRASDLREWEEEPEEWEKREEAEGEDWEFSIRPCAEKLFLDLAINYKNVLEQPLLTVFQSIATPDNEDILLKDSIYTAVGLAAPVVRDHLDFDGFLANTLVVEVQKTTPGFNIIRRRAAILLGQWITIKVGADSKSLVYQIFQHLLTRDQPLNDQVVRVTAGRQLKHVVDDWEFAAEKFMPFAEAILQGLMQLISEVELIETKMALLNTISIIVERLEHNIAPFAEEIMSLLPPLWEQSGEEHLMKQAILTILTRLVTSMKAESVPFHAMVIPIIENAVKPDSETQVYLLEDAMELWASILVQTPQPASEQLLSLSQHLFHIFDLGSDSLRKALEITESYVLLAPSHMLADDMRRQILASMSNLVGTLKPDANGLVFVVLETVIRAAEKLAGEAAILQTILDLHTTGVLQKLLSGLRGSWKAHCTTGPLAEAPPVDGIVETDYFAVLARLILGSTNNFCEAVQVAAPEIDNVTLSLDESMKWLLEEWFNHFENIGDPSRRKLMCLALTKLLDTNQPWILVSLQSLMTMWTDVVRELYEDSQEQMGDTLIKADVERPDGPEAPEDLRRREMSLTDPVHSIHTIAWIKHHLQQVIAAQPHFQDEWVVNVDKEVVKAFSELGII
ncbi:hypothetical protein AMS68_003969 [Peltaster fructicola]|uniref:Importin N-terminal domain-containing protein n=1 Tax=Peltaster fructicola TaxID=286661 RepID=A0A6H0XUM1_9PEZI|nr:hypothetical protein AMS68_003969 [Peltaster fructicola]